ncbi:MAG: stage 0 sporulation protein [Clostridiales bacterium]|nr:stage 0 sporulation protein [Clostridiales bacterium]
MAEVISVRFKEGGRVYYFDPAGHQIARGSRVVVETARGAECGECVRENWDAPDSQIVQPLKKVVRPASEADVKRAEENRKREKEAFVICEKKILEHKLEMKLVDVEYTFDNSKILFYFTADGRVDFRSLVKDLAAVFRTRIELRQIGVRDEAKMLGGMGICGQPFCCSRFLDDFQPVSIKMAKEQGLSLNPVKISGTCGRLMCCLKYEQDAYEYLSSLTPRPGTPVMTEDGRGVVIDANLITGKLKVQLNDSDAPPREYHRDDVKNLRERSCCRERSDQPGSGGAETSQPAGETSPAYKNRPRPDRNARPYKKPDENSSLKNEGRRSSQGPSGGSRPGFRGPAGRQQEPARTPGGPAEK